MQKVYINVLLTLNMDFDSIYYRLLGEDYTHEQADQMLEKLKKIDVLRKKKNAVILAHYYQSLPIQLIADICGDSLALAMCSEKIKGKSLVVSSTVHFMAEMVKLLNPEKKVIIPNPAASCSIAEGMNGATVRKIREKFPKASIIGYINSTAEVKAELDVCCTSANAVQVIQKMQGDPLILLPDEYFALNVLKETTLNTRCMVYSGMEKGDIVLLDAKTLTQVRIPNSQPPQLDKGICIVHKEFKKEQIDHYRKLEHVDLVLAHPEVHPEVAAKADMVGGTSKMLKYVGTTDAKRILYLTECDLAAPLIEQYPEKKFITPCVLCPFMKKNSVDLLLFALENECVKVNIPQKIETKARASVTRMLELTS
jgi:quinolinate synthase